MKSPLRFSTAAVAVAISLIAISTVILSSISYVRWAGKEKVVDDLLSLNIGKRAEQFVGLIEQKVIENDRLLSEMIDIDAPATWPAAAARIRQGDFNVENVFIYRFNSDYPLYPAYSWEIRNSWDRMRRAFNELKKQPPVAGQIYHLHKERQENYFFASYVLKVGQRGGKYLVFFEIPFDRALRMIDRSARDLMRDYYVSIVDFDKNGVYEQPISSSTKYYIATLFPSTFYKWIVQVVPRNYTEMEKNAADQRRANLILIILSMAMIFCSLVVIYLASRRERQLTQLKEDFISNVSHELKTPLSLIRMFSEMLVTNRVRSEDARQEYYGIIHSESDRMGRLITNLLDFSRLERERQSLHLEDTDVARLVTKELEAFRYQLQKEGFELSTTVDGSVPETAVDANAISMALFNLLDNAVKYAGDSRKIAVAVVRDDGYIDISVKDEGIGIPESEKNRIFEKFFRGSGARVRGIRGSGIGLAITRQVAEMHGGQVQVQSEPGKGSTFTLRIPIRTRPRPAENPRDAAG
jgi:two-component system phosphate regulon sensor histidine kinase PhoR